MAFIQKDDFVLHYHWISSNKEKTIILINSLGTSYQIWDQVVGLLKGHFNILLFDKRGHGLSTTSSGDVSIDDYADDVIFLMNQLNIEKASLLGLSIGGLITYSLASRYESRFDKLIFSNTGAKIGTEDSWNERINDINKIGLPALSGQIITRWVSENFRTTKKAATAGYKNMLEKTDTSGYLQACSAIKKADYTTIVSQLKHPALYMGGSKDQGTTPDFVRQNARTHGAEAHIIDGVGHLPCIEAPEKVAEIVVSFLKKEAELSLYDRGMLTRRSVLGDEHVDRAEANKTDFDKDFQEYIVNSAWGSIWSRPQLSKRERSMITIAILATLGHEEELAMHFRATLNTGATEEDVKEVLLHAGIYAGVPVTNNAMKVAKEVFTKVKKGQHE